MVTPAVSITSDEPQQAGEKRNEKQPQDTAKQTYTDIPYDQQEHRVAHVIKGKILNGEKLSYANRDDWLFDLRLWALRNGIWFIISKETSDIVRRESIKETSLFRAQDAAALSTIFQSLEEDDRLSAHGYDDAASLVRYLERKYKTALESITQDHISDFYSYKIKNQGIRTSHVELKTLARKIRENDSHLGATMTPRHIFNRLLTILPRELIPLGSMLRAQGVEIEEGLAQLEETEKALGATSSTKRERSHYSNDRSSPSSKARGRSSPKVSYSPPRGRPRRRPSRRQSSSSSSASLADSRSELVCYRCDEIGHSSNNCPNRELISRLLREHRKKSSSRTSSQRPESSRRRQSSPSPGKKASKSVHFRRAKALLVDSDTEQDDVPRSNDQGASDDSDGNNFAQVAIEMVGTSADADRVSTQARSLHIGEISFMAHQSRPSSSAWIYDSGATAHMTDQIDAFESDPTVNESGRRKVMVGGGTLSIKGRGTINVKLPHSNLRLHNALFVPHLGANLLSSSRIVSNGFYALHDHKYYIVHKQSDNKSVFKAERLNDERLWTAIWAANDLAESTERAYPADEYETVGVDAYDQSEAHFDASRLYQLGATKTKVFKEYNQWHCRLGHVNGRKLRYLHEVSNLPNAIPAKSPIEHKCDACSTAKAKKNRNHELAEHAKAPLDLVSADICGAFPVSKHWEETYFLEAIDNYTRRSVVFTGPTRKDVAEQLFEWKKTAELQVERRLKAIRIDNGRELESRAREWERESSVQVQLTAAYTSSQNGTAERALQSTQSMMRSMLAHAQLPEEYWNLAVLTASFVKNRLPDGPNLVNVDGSTLRQSPEQAWSKRRPHVNTLRVFGSKCFVYVDKPENKASQRGEVGIFLGYVNSSQYWVEIVKSGVLKRVDAARVLVDETIPGGTLLPRSTNEAPQTIVCDSPPASSRVGEGVESPGTLANSSREGHQGQPSVVDCSRQGTLVNSSRQGPDFLRHGTGNQSGLRQNGKLPERDCAVPYSTISNRQLRSSRLGSDKSGQDLVSLDISGHKRPELSIPPRTELDISSDKHESVGVENSESVGVRKSDLAAQHEFNTVPSVKSKSQRLAGVYIPAPRVKRRAEDDIEPEESKKTRLSPQEVKSAVKNTTPEIDTIMAQTAFLVRATEIDQLDGVKNRVPIPTNYNSAINDPIHGRKWQEAVQKELDGLIGNQTWQEEKLPKNVNQVTSKWVFTVKYNIDGSIERYKARLVARGFTQIYGQDFEETFAPTIRIDSLRMLMAIMAVEDMEAEQVDVNNAFTESKLRETIYMKPPLGVEIRPGSTLRLLQSLYGLKQSAREWYLRCSKVLKGIGFKSINSDPCVFIHKNGAIIGLYVDDLVILTPKGNLQAMVDIKDSLSFAFKIKELGAIKRILGIRIHRVRDRCRVYLDQQAYIEKFLHEFAMENPTVKDTAIPISDANSLHRLQDDEELGEIRDYQRKIGSTMFAMVYSRPDICFAMSKLSQYMSNPSVHHEAAVKHLLRYLRTTKAFRICYRASGPKQITGYSDSDFAADKDDRKSVSGFVFTFAGGPISWASRKQKSVTTSTAEAELMALVPATKHAIWLSKFLYEIERSQFIGPNGRTVIMNEDNQAAIKMVNNNQISERSKHIDIGCHFVRERSENQDIKVQYCHTDEMTADGCTKGLAKAKFQSFLKLLGLRVSKDESTYIALTSTRPAQLGLAKGHYLFRASSIVGMQRAVRPSSSPC